MNTANFLLDNLKISIITIVYNREKTIKDTINSVLNQTYKNIEYIIIDGKSTDSTLNIVNSYKDKISKIISEKDDGLYDALNKGINLSKKLQKEGVVGAEKWEGWHSALRNEWEAIALLQKPLENNYPNTVQKWGVGVMKTINKDGSFQSNILNDIPREVKEDFNVHCTVKPVNLIERLIGMIVPEPRSDKIVLDPFMGSGTTAVAAVNLGVGYLGFEVVKDYVAIANNRVSKIK